MENIPDNCGENAGLTLQEFESLEINQKLITARQILVNKARSLINSRGGFIDIHTVLDNIEPKHTEIGVIPLVSEDEYNTYDINVLKKSPAYNQNWTKEHLGALVFNDDGKVFVYSYKDYGVENIPISDQRTAKLVEIFTSAAKDCIKLS